MYYVNNSHVVPHRTTELQAQRNKTLLTKANLVFAADPCGAAMNLHCDEVLTNKQSANVVILLAQDTEQMGEMGQATMFLP